MEQTSETFFIALKQSFPEMLFTFRSFVKYDICDILPVGTRTSHQPSEKGVEKKKMRKNSI